MFGGDILGVEFEHVAAGHICACTSFSAPLYSLSKAKGASTCDALSFDHEGPGCGSVSEEPLARQGQDTCQRGGPKQLVSESLKGPQEYLGLGASRGISRGGSRVAPG